MKFSIKNTIKIYDEINDEIEMNRIFYPDLNLMWTPRYYQKIGWVLKIYSNKEISVSPPLYFDFQKGIKIDDLLKYKKMRDIRRFLKKAIADFIKSIKERGKND